VTTGIQLASSPSARMLLELGARRADGSLELGGRRVTLRGGDVVDVSGLPGDPAIDGLLVDAGELAADQAADLRRRALAGEGRLAAELATVVAPDAIHAALRSTWVHRLAAAFEREARDRPSADQGGDGDVGRLFVPEPPAIPSPADEPAESVVALVLDALSQRADAELTEDDAEVLRAQELVWEDTAHRRAAARWCGLDDSDAPVSTWDDDDVPGGAPIPLAGHVSARPRVAARIAAVVRAGLARLRRPGSVAPAPPRRPPSLVPAPQPVRTARRRPRPLAAEPPSPRDHLATDPLAPGLAEIARPGPLPAPLHRFREVVAPLDDPLDAVERRIRRLEEADAPGPERAEAWRDAARLWQSHHRSLEEAARAFREAAAADPDDAETLAQTALLCIAAARPEAARAYARAAAGAAADDPAESRMWQLVARLAWRRGDLLEASDAYRRALTADPADAEPAESLAWLLWAQGEDDQAVVVTRLAAARQSEAAPGPDRARSLLATAFLERPDNPALAREYAAALVAEGRHEAAVAVLGFAARQIPPGDERQALLMAAAERAEAAALTAVAASSLLLAFDEQPSLEAIHQPLLDDLAGSGAVLDRALVLEEMGFSRELPARRRSAHLLLASEAHGELPEGRPWALDLAVRALALDPRNERAGDRVRELADATEDPGRLPEALEAAYLRGQLPRTADDDEDPDPGAFDGLLRELAEHAEKRLGSARRALRCWQRLASRHPDDAIVRGEIERLEAPAHAEEARLGQAEAELGSATGERRTRAVRRVVALSRDAPEQRERARALLEGLLEEHPQDTASATLLEQLLAVEGSDDRTAAHLWRRLPHASAPERRRIGHRLAALEAARGRFRASAEASELLLHDDPRDATAAARLERAGRRLGDAGLLRRALRHRAQGTDWGTEQVVRQVRLAELLEAEGAFDDAWRTLAAALEPSPPPPEALLFAAPRLDAVPQETAARALAAASHVFGDSAHLLAHIVDGTGGLDDEVREEAFTRWAALAPRDPERASRWLAWCTRNATEPAPLRDAVVAALATPGAEAAPSLRLAIERLAALPAIGDAAAVALEALDRLGDRDADWSALALDLAQATGNDETLLGALERLVCRQRGPEKLGTLGRIAALHRSRGDVAGEARAHLRVLATAPDDRGALERLTDLYAEAGEPERLLAVLALRLEAARTPDVRRERLLDLAAACANLADDPDRAAEYLGVVAQEADADDVDAIALVAGGLCALGRPRSAYDMLVGRARATAAGDPDPLARRRASQLAGGLFERAVAVAERELADPSLALESALEGLARAPHRTSLLLAFERLALHLGNVATAKETYARLVDRAMGPHGRRSLLYREARWLERAGDPRGALEAYRWAFALAPTHGVVYKALVRLAAQLGEWEDVVDAATRLSDRAPGAVGYVEHRREAAAAAEGRLDDPRRAFDLLADAWTRQPTLELEAEVRRLLRWIVADDVSRGIHHGPGPHPGVARVADVLRERALNALEADERVAGLERLAAFYAGELGLVDQAAAVVDEALELADRSGLPASAAADLRCALAEWLADDGRLDDARDQLDLARAEAPGHARARALGDLFDARRRSSAPSDRPERITPPSGIPTWTTSGAVLDRPDPPFSEPPASSSRSSAPSPALGQETWGTPPPTPPYPPLREMPQVSAKGPVGSLAPPALTPAGEDDDGDPRDAGPGGSVPDPGADTPGTAGGGGEDGPAAPANPSSSRPGALPWVLTEAPHEAPPGPGVAGGAADESGDADEGAVTDDAAAASGAAPADDGDPDRTPTPQPLPPEPPRPSGTAPRPGRARRDQSGLRVARSSEGGPPVVGAAPTPPHPGLVVPPSPPPFRGEPSPSAFPRASARPSAVFTPVPREDAPPREDEDTNEAMLRSAVARGDVDAAERLALRLATQPDRLHDAAPLLRNVVRQDPARVQVIRALQDASERLGDHTVADVATELLSLFDPRVRPPSRVPGVGFGAFVEDPGSLLTDSRLLAPLSLLQLAWETATPLFRKTLPELGLVGTDRLSPLGPSPAAQALREAQEILRPGDIDAFRKRLGSATVQVLATTPPAVLLSPDLDDEEDADRLRFRVARAVELTRPELVLLATLDEAAGATLLDGLRAAFGPPEAVESVGRDAAALAAELWRTVPARDQNRMRALLEETADDRFTYPRLHTEVLAAAARAGLLVAGSVRASLLGLSQDEPALRAHALDDERDWVLSCARSSSLRALVRLSLSDAYLVARRQWERRGRQG